MTKMKKNDDVVGTCLTLLNRWVCKSDDDMNEDDDDDSDG
jgi:hypothetical protein